MAIGSNAVVTNNDLSHAQGLDEDSREILDDNSSSENDVRTAHALFKEGSTDCLALSRRGLFTAGRVTYILTMRKIILICCFCFRVVWYNATM